jgi:hypothetical protein
LQVLEVKAPSARASYKNALNRRAAHAHVRGFREAGREDPSNPCVVESSADVQDNLPTASELLYLYIIMCSDDFNRHGCGLVALAYRVCTRTSNPILEAPIG